MAAIIQFNEDDALMLDPFEGDFGDGETRIVNEIVTAPEPPRCHSCGGRITPGTRMRRIVEQIGDEAEGDEPEDIKRTEYLFCQHCCGAMAKDVKDGGDRLGSRTARMLRQRAEKEAAHG
ncbi:hypothetical protein D3093_30010 (plasmid) [Azospirillum argentinense]|uniref:Uncharacterized protein n=1 Tax=Azospirillum argentinense TaxID=2970906 RepID=A0A4D8PYC6_9PROT|nr:hypothetical protein [Azospirillum argentinense]QCN99461.1 hypothetical protein D3093_30010 [Azospirillum argentinense]